MIKAGQDSPAFIISIQVEAQPAGPPAVQSAGWALTCNVQIEALLNDEGSYCSIYFYRNIA